MTWIVHSSVWGDDLYRHTYLSYGIPAIHQAMQYAQTDDVRFIIHTDISKEFFPDYVEIRQLPNIEQVDYRLAETNRKILHEAKIGDRIIFLNADMVASRELFVACNLIFETGRTFVSCASIRVKRVAPPIGARATDLLEWSWRNRHVFVEDCVFGRGKVEDPPHVIFDDGSGSVVMHAYDLQPLAINKKTSLRFLGPTSCEMIDMFSIEDVHVISNEIAIVEMVVGHLHYGALAHKFTHKDIMRWGRHFAAIHHDQFRKQIVILGDKIDYAQNFADAVVDELECPL